MAFGSRHELEKYYRGDADWLEFVSMFESAWSQLDAAEAAELLHTVHGHEDLAKVLSGRFGDREIRMDWLNMRVPMLDDLTPSECLSSESLLRRLKVALMRMPD